MAITSMLNDRLGFVLNPDGLNSKAQGVANKAEEYRQIIRNYTVLTISLSAVWEGQSETKFAATYQNALPVLGKLADLCDTAAAAMQQYASEVNAADKSAASKIRSCF